MITRSYRKLTKRYRPHLYHGPRVRNPAGKKMLLTPWYCWVTELWDHAKLRGQQRRLEASSRAW